MIKVFENPERLQRAAAELFADQARLTIEQRGQFRVVLSGGKTPRPVYQLLAASPFRKQVDWPAVKVFWGDERCVPPNDTRSNERMAREALLDRVPLAPSKIHPIACTGEGESAAARYEALLRTEFPEGEPRFDLVLLGLGDDGHTASLFPGSAALLERRRWSVPVRREGEAFERVSLTFTAINHSRVICFLVAGSNKAHAFELVTGRARGGDRLPASLVSPIDGKLFWYVDRAAAIGEGEEIPIAVDRSDESAKRVSGAQYDP